MPLPLTGPREGLLGPPTPSPMILGGWLGVEGAQRTYGGLWKKWRREEEMRRSRGVSKGVKIGGKGLYIQKREIAPVQTRWPSARALTTAKSDLKKPENRTACNVQVNLQTQSIVLAHGCQDQNPNCTILCYKEIDRTSLWQSLE